MLVERSEQAHLVLPRHLRGLGEPELCGLPAALHEERGLLLRAMPRQLLCSPQQRQRQGLRSARKLPLTPGARPRR
jgi:hypothetical protein